MLTGKKVLGVGDASGMFPIDIETGKYDAKMVSQFDEAIADKGYPWKLMDIFPEVLSAGEDAGTLTQEGAKLLDTDGDLEAGVPLCPPEGWWQRILLHGAQEMCLPVHRYFLW